MKYLSSSLIFCTMIAIFLLVSGTIDAGQSKVDLRKVKTDFKRADRSMIEGVQMIGKQLTGLTKDQMASVAALVAMTRAATLMEGQKKFGQVMEGFWKETSEICPPLPKDTMKRFGDCRDHDLDYGVSMARCLEEGKSESECERENYGSLQMAAQCRMKKIEELNDVIRVIPGHDWPNPPIPWPEIH